MYSALNNEGRNARSRVSALVGYNLERFDPFDGNTIGDCYGRVKRAYLEKAIKTRMITNNRIFDDNTYWIQCPYCLYCYDLSRQTIEVDHFVPWRQYLHQIIELFLYDELNISMLHLYIACNDPENLRLVCSSCNRSKGDRNITDDWCRHRREEANRTRGFYQ